MDYKKLYEEALERAKKMLASKRSVIVEKQALETIFPELKESEDERIRKELMDFVIGNTICKDGRREKYLAWLEKQKETFTKKDVDDAYLKGVCDAKQELEKQGEQMIAKGERMNVALSIINYLDDNRVAGCMDLSSMECEDIEDACVNSKWTKLYNYMKKKLETPDVSDYNPYEATVKSIIAMTERYANGNDLKDFYDNVKVKCKEAVDYDKTWLEKTSKQESTDEPEPTNIVKPDFKVGDWIVFENKVGQITGVQEDCYIGRDTDGWYFALSKSEGNSNAHLWTINDAKDGDVLASKDKLNILIFRNLDTSTSFSSYYNIAGKGELGWSNECFIPSTKEQRELLFAKMKEAGYEWDADKKELKKIEQKSAWSEDDEIGLDDALWCCKQAASIAKDENDMGNAWYAENWLKSIKDRIGYGLICAVKDDESTDEQNPTDKVKIKFKIGDWITNGCLHYKIIDVLENDYIVDTGFAKRKVIPIRQEKYYHLWTIRDAKDGDVLVDTSSDKMIIFHKIGNETWNDVIDYYVAAKDGYFNIPKGVQYWSSIHTCKLKPATADQRDLLFKQIGKDGYMWDEHTKMLICSTNMKSK